MSRAHTQLLRNLVRYTGHDPEGYHARVGPEGTTILVRGPQGAAYYQLEGWASKFLRHQHSGYFAGAARRAASGSGAAPAAAPVPRTPPPAGAGGRTAS